MGSETFHPTPKEAEAGSVVIPFPQAAFHVVCGTDFSQAAMNAADVAACLARRLDEPLTLVHAFDEPSRTLLPKELRDSLRSFEEQQLRDEAFRLQTPGVGIREAFCEGAPADTVSGFAQDPSTRLLVISASRHPTASRWMPGSVADRVTHSSARPVLVVRDPAPFVAWLQGKRKLKVFSAADFSLTSDAALTWVRWLRKLGRCDITVAYVESPIISDNMYGAQPSPGAQTLIARIEQTEEACFRRRVRSILSTNRVRVRFEKGWAHSDAHLIQLAQQDEADLIVVGMNERNGLSRAAHHSVSRAIVRYAPMNVACVPSHFANASSVAP